MKLRDVIRTIVQEVVGDDLRQIVKEILVEELMDTDSTIVPDNPRVAAAKKAAKTRRTNRAAMEVHSAEVAQLPRAARKAGVAVGQIWEGKPNSGVAGRVIEICLIDRTGVVPRVISAATKRTNAKHIGFNHLRRFYTLREAG